MLPKIIIISIYLLHISSLSDIIFNRLKRYNIINGKSTHSLKLSVQHSGKNGLDYKFEQVYEAALIFNFTNGHVRVPQKYQIPESNEWPKHLHGLKLGSIINSIKYYNKYSTEPYKSKLSSIGICSECGTEYRKQVTNNIFDILKLSKVIRFR